MKTHDIIAQIREAEAKATPGPLKRVELPESGIYVWKDNNDPFYNAVAQFICDDGGGASEQEIADAEAYILARNNILTLCGEVERLQKDKERLAEAVLLFYSVGPWDEQKHLRWVELTGADESTTKVLGDLCRAAMTKG